MLEMQKGSNWSGQGLKALLEGHQPTSQFVIQDREPLNDQEEYPYFSKKTLKGYTRTTLRVQCMIEGFHRNVIVLPLSWASCSANIILPEMVTSEISIRG